MKQKYHPIIMKIVKKTDTVSDAVAGLIIHQRLPPESEERIRKFDAVFAEFYADAHEKWLEGFQRDLDPESEVGVWEAMAHAYQTFLAEQALSPLARKEAFRLLISAAGTIEESLSRAKLYYLSRQGAEHLLQLYAAAMAKSEQPFSPN